MTQLPRGNCPHFSRRFNRLRQKCAKFTYPAIKGSVSSIKAVPAAELPRGNCLNFSQISAAFRPKTAKFILTIGASS